MAKKGGSYYYVTAGERKWIPLGRDLRTAKARWAELEGGCTRETVGTLLERYIALVAVKDSSRRQYESWARALCEEFGERAVDSLQTPQVALWRDRNSHRAAYINGCLAILRGAYERAREWGWCDHNPVPRRTVIGQRHRLLRHEDFRRIRLAAVPWLRCAMDLAYVTGLRQSDVLALRWRDVGSSLVVRQVKTGNRQDYELGPSLAAVLESCKARKVLGLYVIADQKGRPIKQDRLQRHYREAAKKAGVPDTGFHDIRALAATDARKQGLDATALLGHRNARQTETYLRDLEAIKATPLKGVL
jgi:integrase